MQEQESPWTDGVPEMEFDVIDEASAESFPASDPPMWATGQGRRVAPRDASTDRLLEERPMGDDERGHRESAEREHEGPIH